MSSFFPEVDLMDIAHGQPGELLKKFSGSFRCVYNSDSYASLSLPMTDLDIQKWVVKLTN